MGTISGLRAAGIARAIPMQSRTGVDNGMMPSIGGAISSMGNEIITARELLAELSNKLSPILRPRPDTSGSEKVPTPIASPLVNEINDLKNHLHVTNDLLRELLLTIEIN